MPAATLAGALALAGCGGSDNPAPVKVNDALSRGNLQGSGPNGAFTDSDCVTINGAGSGATANGKGCTLSTAQTTQSDFAKKGGTPGALLDKEGTLNIQSAMSSASDFSKLKPSDLIEGLHGNVNPGMKWDAVLKAVTVKFSNGPGKGVKVTGKDLSDLGSPNVTSHEGGISVQGSTYMGIPGSLVCNAASGSTCGKNGDDELTGDWYFSATEDDAHWVKAGKKYVKRDDKPHADWGVWLTRETSDKPGRIIQWYVNAGPDYDATDHSLLLTKSPGLLDKATYKGAAVGISTLYNTDDPKVGTFTADAELTAAFSTSPTLSGKITGFKGSAVNEKWVIELENRNIANDEVANGVNGSGSSVLATGVSTNPSRTSFEDDRWSAQLYGEHQKRPTGVAGDFFATFPTQGEAVGVFHAK